MFSCPPTLPIAHGLWPSHILGLGAWGDNCVNTAIVDVDMALKAALNGNTIKLTPDEKQSLPERVNGQRAFYRIVHLP